jgi:histidine triad (HIT) family protein
MPASLDSTVLACPRRTAVAVAVAVERAFAAMGTTINQNNGSPGQTLFHVHFHVTPRYSEDGELSAPYDVVDLAVRVAQARAVASVLANDPDPPESDQGRSRTERAPGQRGG